MVEEISKEERARRATIVVEQCDGIEPQCVAFYAQAILYAAERADASFVRFKEGVNKSREASEVVGSVHEALGHTAALSRFFFVGKTASDLAKARARHLRRLFDVEDTSMLMDRDLKNALEHFDERLDQFLLGDVFGYIFPGAMLGEADLAGDERGHIFRMVDPQGEAFILLGKVYQFGPVMAEVRRIAEIARLQA